MAERHTSVENYSLSDHVQLRRSIHRKILLDHQREGKIILPDNFAADSLSNWTIDEYYFLQPVPVRERRALLHDAGISRIDPTERDECRTLRTSRGRCGCSCRDVCRPPACACYRVGIGCQVDQMAFPCSCSRTGCANPHGRVEFNAARVRAHFVRTLMQLGMEQNCSETDLEALPPPLKRCRFGDDSFDSTAIANAQPHHSEVVTNGFAAGSSAAVFFDSADVSCPETTVEYEEEYEDYEGSETSSEDASNEAAVGDLYEFNATAYEAQPTAVGGYFTAFDRRQVYASSTGDGYSFPLHLNHPAYSPAANLSRSHSASYVMNSGHCAAAGQLFCQDGSTLLSPAGAVPSCQFARDNSSCLFPDNEYLPVGSSACNEIAANEVVRTTSSTALPDQGTSMHYMSAEHDYYVDPKPPLSVLRTGGVFPHSFSSAAPNTSNAIASVDSSVNAAELEGSEMARQSHSVSNVFNGSCAIQQASSPVLCPIDSLLRMSRCMPDAAAVDSAMVPTMLALSTVNRAYVATSVNASVDGLAVTEENCQTAVAKGSLNVSDDSMNMLHACEKQLDDTIPEHVAISRFSCRQQDLQNDSAITVDPSADSFATEESWRQNAAAASELSRSMSMSSEQPSVSCPPFHRKLQDTSNSSMIIDGTLSEKISGAASHGYKLNACDNQSSAGDSLKSVTMTEDCVVSSSSADNISDTAPCEASDAGTLPDSSTFSDPAVCDADTGVEANLTADTDSNSEGSILDPDCQTVNVQLSFAEARDSTNSSCSSVHIDPTVQLAGSCSAVPYSSFISAAANSVVDSVSCSRQHSSENVHEDTQGDLSDDKCSRERGVDGLSPCSQSVASTVTSCSQNLLIEVQSPERRPTNAVESDGASVQLPLTAELVPFTTVSLHTVANDSDTSRCPASTGPCTATCPNSDLASADGSQLDKALMCPGNGSAIAEHFVQQTATTTETSCTASSVQVSDSSSLVPCSNSDCPSSDCPSADDGSDVATSSDELFTRDTTTWCGSADELEAAASCSVSTVS